MLYLTYDINKNQDGAGAQYQRVVGVITIAMTYNLEYVHTKINNMEHIDKNYSQKIHNFFGIESNYKSVDNYKYDNVYEEYDPTDESIKKYINMSKNSNILLKIFLSHNIVFNNDTTLLNKSINILRTYLKMPSLPYYENIPQNQKKIAIHIRRGDVSSDINSDRYVSIEKYINIINKFNEMYSDCKIFILTEIDDKNKNEFDIITKNNNVKLLANIDIIETFGYMINADLLVICKSSFSYLSGIYNKNIVYYFDFWHKPCKNWININNLLNTTETFTNTNNKYYYYILIFIFIIIIILLIFKNKISLFI